MDLEANPPPSYSNYSITVDSRFKKDLKIQIHLQVGHFFSAPTF